MITTRERADEAPTSVWAQGSRSKVEYVDETPRKPRRSPEEIEAERELGHAFVTLLSVERPTPRFFGDNRGMLPIWVESSGDWRQSGLVFERQQTAMRAVRLNVLAVPSDEHARRLKHALDEALGIAETTSENESLRNAHRFKNGVDWGDLDTWWLPLLEDALMTCELAARDFELFSRGEHETRVAARARLIIERQRRGRGR